MDGVSHMTVGAVAASTLGQEKSFATQMAIGIASHFFADLTPSYDPDPRKAEVLPYLAGAACVFAFLLLNDPEGRNGLIAGAIGGILPDIEHVTHYLTLQPKKVFPTHMGDPEAPTLQTPIPKKWGLPLILAVNGFALGYVAITYGKKREEKKKLRAMPKKMKRFSLKKSRIETGSPSAAAKLELVGAAE